MVWLRLVARFRRQASDDFQMDREEQTATGQQLRKWGTERIQMKK